MSDIYETTAVFSDEKTLVLDRALPIAGGSRVKIILEPLVDHEPPETTDFLAALESIHKTLFASGFVSPTRDEVDAELEAVRNEWNS